jgi:hypothetical protein
MDMFPALIGLAFYPVSVEVLKDSVEVFGGLGKSVPLLGIVFEKILVLILLGFLRSVPPSSWKYGAQSLEILVEIDY